jgi:hypothetical protein
VGGGKKTFVIVPTITAITIRRTMIITIILRCLLLSFYSTLPSSSMRYGRTQDGVEGDDGEEDGNPGHVGQQIIPSSSSSSSSSSIYHMIRTQDRVECDDGEEDGHPGHVGQQVVPVIPQHVRSQATPEGQVPAQGTTKGSHMVGVGDGWFAFKRILQGESRTEERSTGSSLE